MIKNPLNPINFIECEGVLKGYIDRINKYLVGIIYLTLGMLTIFISNPSHTVPNKK